MAFSGEKQWQNYLGTGSNPSSTPVGRNPINGLTPWCIPPRQTQKILDDDGAVPAITDGYIDGYWTRNGDRLPVAIKWSTNKHMHGVHYAVCRSSLLTSMLYCTCGGLVAAFDAPCFTVLCATVTKESPEKSLPGEFYLLLPSNSNSMEGWSAITTSHGELWRRRNATQYLWHKAICACLESYCWKISLPRERTIGCLAWRNFALLPIEASDGELRRVH